MYADLNAFDKYINYIIMIIEETSTSEYLFLPIIRKYIINVQIYKNCRILWQEWAA